MTPTLDISMWQKQTAAWDVARSRVFTTTWAGGTLSKDNNGINLVIEGNIMRVANEVYHLGNIARVSTYVHHVGFDGGPFKAIWVKKWWFILLAATFYVLNAYGKGADVHTAQRVLVFVALATIAHIVWILRQRNEEYVLLIESSGVVRGLLASSDSAVIDNIITLIANSIRNPPISAITRHFNNVTSNVNNTAIHQHGDGNIGQQFMGAEGAVNK
jgi:hypothetical protein